MIEPDARTTKTKRILVVANETVENRALHDVIRERTDGTQAEVRVVAPALNSRLAHWFSDEDGARRAAAERLSGCLTQLDRDGVGATGHVGDGDPLLAIDDSLQLFPADEIIIATHPEPRSNWLARNLVENARRRYPVPVHHVIAQPAAEEASRSSGTLAAMRIAVLALAALLFASVTPAGGAQVNGVTGVVGPGSTITFSSSDGAAVRQLAPGTYAIAVRDLADDHNFRLTGPDVDRKTGVAEIVDTTWTVALVAGTYTFLCDPHPTSMRGQFIVSSQTTTPTTLVATVGPKGTLSLTRAGRKVSTLSAGRYRIVVKDKSAKDNLHLIGAGIDRKTSVAMKTTVTWIVTLRAGSYTFRSDSSAALKNVLRVTTG